MQKEIIISTKEHNELIDITKEIEKIVSESKVKQGLCNVFITHATAAILINENYDPNVMEDIINALNKIIPEHNNYKHDKIDNNAAASSFRNFLLFMFPNSVNTVSAIWALPVFQNM